MASIAGGIMAINIAGTTSITVTITAVINNVGEIIIIACIVGVFVDDCHKRWKVARLSAQF